MFKVISLRTDDALDEGSKYLAEWKNEPAGNVWEPSGQPVRVHYKDWDGRARTCIRYIDIDVITSWAGVSGHDPYTFNA